jgi:hypothetical protein
MYFAAQYNHAPGGLLHITPIGTNGFGTRHGRQGGAYASIMLRPRRVRGAFLR